MKNWKTTLAGILVIGATFFAALQEPKDFETRPAMFVAGLLAGAGLIAAKDHDQA